DRRSEPRRLYKREHKQRPPGVQFIRFHAQRLPGLRHRLHQKHAGQDRMARGMTGEIGRILPRLHYARQTATGDEALAAVEQEKGMPVRQERFEVRPGQRRHESSDLPFGFREARRRSAATSRKNSRLGFAGEPTQRSPAGTSHITPANAPSTAPSPTLIWSATPARPPIMTPAPIVE